MKAVVWLGPRRMELQNAPEPQPQAGEVILRVDAVGICGSELSGYLGQNSLRVPPLVMGHEFAGKVAALGEGAVARNPSLAQGQAVTVNPLSSCGTCDYCARGLNHLCARRKLLGAHLPGAYAEYVLAPAESVLPLPAGMSERTGALTEPVAVAVRIGELASAARGEVALIVGAGPIGLLALQALLANGTARVFISDLEPARLAMAADLGGEALHGRETDVVKTVREATGGRGAAVAVDAVGSAVTRAQCIAATRAAGTVILTGLHEESSTLPVADVIRREIVVRGSFAYTPANFADALARLAKGAMRLDPWIVEAPLSEGGMWFDRLIEEPGGVAKVLLVPGDES